MNILEQEDQLKGMPDSMLLVEMEQPSGMYPPFLVASEQQRRNTMRENYAATEQQPQTTVVEREYQKGLASSAMPPSSPAPVAPNSLPSSFPVDGYSQGSMGAGDLLVANTGGQFPDLSGDGKVTRKDILMGRGVVTMDAGRQVPSGLESITMQSARFREAAREKLLREGRDPSTYSQRELAEIGKQIVESGESYNLEQQGYKRFRPDLGEEYTPESMEYGLLSFDPNAPSNVALDAIKSGAEAIVQPSGAESVSSNIEAQQRALLGEQAEAAGQDVAESVTDYLESDPMPVQIARGSMGLMQDYLSPHISGLKSAAMNVASLPGQLYDKGYELYSGAGDAIGSTADAFDSAVYDLLGMGEDLDRDLSAEEQAEMDAEINLLNTANQEQAYLTGLNKPEIQEEVAVVELASSEGDITPNETVQTGSAVRTDVGRMGFDTKFDPNLSLGVQNIGGEQKALTEMYEGLDDFDTAQADQVANLRDLIGRTREEAKNRAFYMGMAALGSGIMKGDMAGGMDKAIQVASDITARGEASIAPLEAAAATQPAQAAKERIDALAAIARADATFQNVAASIFREQGLNERSYNTVRGYAIRAMQDAIEANPYMEDLDTPQKVAKAINQGADEMMGDYAPLMQGQLGEDFIINEQTGNLQFRNSMPSQ